VSEKTNADVTLV